MKVISVIGLLGAGKSTLIEAMLAAAARRGLRSGVVVNDSGEVSLETEEILRTHPVQVIGGG